MDLEGLDNIIDILNTKGVPKIEQKKKKKE